MVHVGIVAGEASGDQLGAALIDALRLQCPGIRITGMAGPKMLATGCEPVASIDELSVMGVVEVVRRYPELRRLRDRVLRFYLDDRPDVFVGIDVPDFVTGIESRLYSKNIKTVHYVAPQIWAWRKSRAKTLSERLDRLLVLFPFEEYFFRCYGVDTRFVGHPVADQIPLARDVVSARRKLGLESTRPYVALMPGSRVQEWKRHVDVFLSAANLVAKRNKETAFVAGAIDGDAETYFLKRAASVSPGIELTVRRGRSHDVLGASNAAIVASGTITMEGVFTKTPLVVGYRLAPMSYFLMKRLVTVRHIAMPNVLASQEIVPEFVQSAMTADALAGATIEWLENEDKVRKYEAHCSEAHHTLRRDAATQAAEAVLGLVQHKVL
ncbi:MAG TPA: lipid-A-disaccharide synthase [Gammaproteobacteria bacterium]|nr:lipid-A-disaccharide synthase [Gammaproteobacteria bacterium]|tara:strand:+ start:857 stop:2002 length:1146 start_codon:yes stop_codon:yes gene_type:complete